MAEPKIIQYDMLSPEDRMSMLRPMIAQEEREHYQYKLAYERTGLETHVDQMDQLAAIIERQKTELSALEQEAQPVTKE
jgi:hypothetical protein